MFLAASILFKTFVKIYSTFVESNILPEITRGLLGERRIKKQKNEKKSKKPINDGFCFTHRERCTEKKPKKSINDGFMYVCVSEKVK